MMRISKHLIRYSELYHETKLYNKKNKNFYEIETSVYLLLT